MFKRLARPLARQFYDQLVSNANAQEYHSYDQRLTEKERNQREIVAWTLRVVATTVYDVFEL